MTSIQAALRPVRGRMRVLRAVRWGAAGLGVGCAAALLVRVCSFLWPIERVLELCLVCGAPPFLGAVFAGLLWPVTAKAAARRADECGLMARVQTALEWQGRDETPMSRLQREDAGRALGALRIKASMPLRARRVWLITAAASLALVFALGFAPNPHRETLRAKAAFRQEMAKQAQLVEEGAKQLGEKDEASARETRKILGEMAKELRAAGDPRQALTAMDQTQRKLEKLRQNSAESLRSLLASQGLSDEADALEKQDMEELRKALEEKDAAGLAEKLAGAAQQAESQAVAQQLNQAAQAAAAGNPAQLQAALGAAMQSATASSAQGSALLQMARAAAARAGQPMGSAGQGNLPQALAALGMQSGNGMTGSGSGGMGMGAGSGAGFGSTNLDAGYTGNAASGHSAGGSPPKEKLGEYEVIYEPTRLGGDGEVANERGMMGQGETTEVTLGAGLGSAADAVPYADVAYEYQQAAVQAAENAGLPAHVRKWVETYFQSLLK